MVVEAKYLVATGGDALEALTTLLVGRRVCGVKHAAPHQAQLKAHVSMDLDTGQNILANRVDVFAQFVDVP